MLDEYMGRLSQKRFQHSVRTAQRARQLAGIFGLDQDKAAFAGLYHDMMRYLSADEYLRAAEDLGVAYGKEEVISPILLHGPLAAAVLAQNGIDDSEILQAVSEHTLARSGMCDLSKVLYLADKTETARNFTGIKDLRLLAEKNLDKAMLLALEYDAKWQDEDGLPFHPQTAEALKWFRQLTTTAK